MNDKQPNFSRRERKKGRSRMNTILNASIAVIFLLIVITASVIFWGNDDKKQTAEDNIIEANKKDDLEKDLELADDSDATEKDNESSEDATDSGGTIENNDGQPETDSESTDGAVSDDATPSDKDVTENPEDITIKASEEDVVSETRVNSAWQPIPTEQTGEHVSSYDDTSIDWTEKKEAIAYATGHPVDSLIYWKVKNGGSPQKSIGIVESIGSSEKYRVYLEWVDGQGWKPVKMDVLNTLDFDY